MNSPSQARQRPLVLNVDPDPANRHIKTRSLVRGQIEVIEAADGISALRIIAEQHPALVLLDTRLPDPDGLELCRRIKADWPDIILLRMTATSISAEDDDIGLESAADCSLTTPVAPMELIAVTRALLRLRHAETQAQAANDRYRMIVETAIDDAILTLSLDGTVMSWSAGAQKIFGYTSDEIIGQPGARLFMADDMMTEPRSCQLDPGSAHDQTFNQTHPRPDGTTLLPSRALEAEMQAARDGINVSTGQWHRRRNGSRFWSSGRIAAQRDQRGDVVGYLKILHDRSSEKQARDALETLTADLECQIEARTHDLEQINARLRAEMIEHQTTAEQLRYLQKIEALGQLSGGIAHDFNNLLTAILGGLEVTRRRIEDPRSLRLIDSSISAAQRAAKLIAKLTAFARRQNLHAEQLPLNPLLVELQELLERSVGDRIQLTYELAPDAWPALADAGQVRTALLDLVLNARDAMPNGGTLRIATGNMRIETTGPDLPAGAYASLAVEDTGTGMSNEVQARLFEPFFTTKQAGRGTGLGLAQAYGFVRQSGGTIRVHSVVGQGTTMTILLPTAVAKEPDPTL